MVSNQTHLEGHPIGFSFNVAELPTFKSDAMGISFHWRM